MYYYDPCYGRIQLPKLVYDLVSSCPELKRLKDLGFTNFDMLSMHSLSKVSRLEHAMGVAYLTSLFLENTLFTEAERNNLLAAAVMHDVGAAPFGHTVEWTLGRYQHFDHEENARWVLTGGDRGYDLEITQMYYEPNLFHRKFIRNREFRKRYLLDPELILAYIQGNEKGQIIAGPGMDLDNIDSVYRMNLYMGIPYDKEVPIRLVRALSWYQDDLLINEKDVLLVQDWLDARYRAYDLFIYDEQYIAFEYMLSKAVETYARELVLGKKARIEPYLWVLTDSRFIQNLYSEGSTKELAKRILLFDFYDLIGIYVSEKVELQSLLTNATEVAQIESTLKEYLENHFKEDYPNTHFSVALHCTTDFRKRFRRIRINVKTGSDQISTRAFGEDKNFLVIGVLTPWKLRSYPRGVRDSCPSVVLDFMRTTLDPNIHVGTEREVSEGAVTK